MRTRLSIAVALLALAAALLGSYGYPRNDASQASGASLLGVSAIDVGRSHTCALVGEEVMCWGLNRDGQLGDGTTTPRTGPVDVAGLGTATAVQAGAFHTCALIAGARAACWGGNDDGQLGVGPVESSPTPLLVGLQGVRALSVGDGHSCAVLNAGSLHCWGDNRQGQLGDGLIHTRDLPHQVWGLDGGVLDVAAGERHTCAILHDRRAVCWGDNASGQLGDGTRSLKAVPVMVAGLEGVLKLAAGSSITCALTDTAQVWCWGNGLLTPTRVPGLSGVPDIAATGGRACAVTAARTLDCWTPGSGGTSPVTGLTDVASIALGKDHACAALASGEAMCWGENGLGQLGDGTHDSSKTPVSVIEREKQTPTPSNTPSMTPTPTACPPAGCPTVTPTPTSNRPPPSLQFDKTANGRQGPVVVTVGATVRYHWTAESSGQVTVDDDTHDELDGFCGFMPCELTADVVFSTPGPVTNIARAEARGISSFAERSDAVTVIAVLVLGDASCSGRTDTLDAALILQLIAGLLTGLPCELVADVNRDGRIDAVDAVLVLQHAAGLIALPAG